MPDSFEYYLISFAALHSDRETHLIHENSESKLGYKLNFQFGFVVA